jgi:hypothetical protein
MIPDDVHDNYRSLNVDGWRCLNCGKRLMSKEKEIKIPEYLFFTRPQNTLTKQLDNGLYRRFKSPYLAKKKASSQIAEVIMISCLWCKKRLRKYAHSQKYCSRLCSNRYNYHTNKQST